MISNNRQRLNNTKAGIETQIKSVLGGDARLDSPDVQSIPIPFTDFNIQSLSYMADQLESQRDLDRNIHRYKKILADGTVSLVRDAREARQVSQEAESVDKNSVAMLMIGTTRAALFLLGNVEQTEAVQKAKDQLYVLFNETMQKNAQYPDKKSATKEIAKFNSKVKDIMVSNGVDKLAGVSLDKDLSNAYNTTNIHNLQNHISTISSFDGRVIVETDVMALGITDEQRKMLDQIRMGKNEIGEAWFDKASEMKKAMIRDVVNTMFDDRGNIIKVIPTQLRNLMPLVKNAYIKFTSVMDGEGLVDVAENMHSAAIYLEVVQDAGMEKELTEMAKQVASFAPKSNLGINQVNSTSPWNLANPAENNANVQSKDAMQRTGNDSCNTPFNMLHIGPRDAGGYDNALNNLSKLLLKYSEALSGYNMPEMSAAFEDIGIWLDNTKDKSTMQMIRSIVWNPKEYENALKAIKYLEESKDSVFGKTENGIKMIQALRRAVDARHLLTYTKSKTDHDNLTLFEHFSSLNAAIHNENGTIREFFHNKLGFQAMLDNISYMSFNCMSGKDRTGVAMFDASVHSVVDFVSAKVQSFQQQNEQDREAIRSQNREPTEQELGMEAAYAKDNGIAKKSELAKVLNANGHTQLIPSQNNIGTHGVKKDSESAQTLEVFKGNTLTRDTAGFNKLKYEKGVKFDAHDYDTRKQTLDSTALAILQDKNSFKDREDARRREHKSSDTHKRT